MFDDVDFDQIGIRSLEYGLSPSEDHVRALKIIRARIHSLKRTPNMDAGPILARIMQMNVLLIIPSADEPIGMTDQTYVSTPLPPLTQDEVAAALDKAAVGTNIGRPIW